MKTSFLFICITVALIPLSCGIRERSEQLNERETALNQKQQELLLREKTLQIKEQELSLREQKMDSTLQQDTANRYNPALVGLWAVKMTCTETTCAGSAVGDTKTEQWDLSYQAGQMLAKASSGNNLVRIYTGMVKNNTIELTENIDTTSTQPSAQMHVRLRLTSETSMEGERDIVRDNGCKIVYSLQMEKQK